MNNILVTGAYGQLGTEVKNLASHYPQYNFLLTDADSLDITDRKALMDFTVGNDIRYIVNCAAYTAVDKAEDDPATCRKINTDAVRNLAKAAQAAGCGIIHVSTDYVFDGLNCIPYTEKIRTRPVSVYGKTKRDGEKTLLLHCPEAVIVRTAWLYSPYGNNFVKTMMRLGRERDQLGVVYDQVGSPTYARDLAAALLTIMDQTVQPGHGKGGIYHFTDEGVCSWYDFTLKIHQLAGIKGCRVSPILSDQYPAKAPRPHYSVLDKAKIKQTFGIAIPHWEESLKHCVNELLKMERNGE